VKARATNARLFSSIHVEQAQLSAKPLAGSEVPLLLRVITMANRRQAAAASAETAATTAEVSEVC
jgi:hypothetical protein